MSQRQIDANRINGAKGGPRTPEGKQISSRNSLRHGFTAKKLVLSTEEEPHFTEMMEGYLEELAPQGLEETDLVREVVAGKWRQERYWELETAIIELSLLETTADITERFDEIEGRFVNPRTKILSNAERRAKEYSRIQPRSCEAIFKPLDL